jgi:hypothetical protein
MNRTLASANTAIAAFVCIALGAAAMARAQDQTEAGRAEVRFLKGTVTASTNESAARPVKAGDMLPSGALVKTGSGSLVDLYLGPNTGTLRLTEKSTLRLDTLRSKPTGADTAVEVQLHLRDGEMYFNVNKLSKASRYEIKVPTGVAGIRGTKGCFSFRPRGSSKPPIVLLEGTLFFVHVPSGEATTSYELTAPPGVYFSPTEGIKPAPPGLVYAVERQLEESSRERKNSEQASKSQAPENSDWSHWQGAEPFLSPGTGERTR